MIAAALACLALLATEPGGAVDFDTEIIPVLTKAGCNAGACHGAAAGRGEFRLSLLGADPAADYEAIVLELEGRRVDHDRPDLSLVLTKPTGLLDHGGELALDPQSAGAQRLRSWLQAGAPPGRGRRLVRFEVAPRRSLSQDFPAQVPLRGVAQFEDGPPVDVVPFVVFTSLDPAAVEVSADQVAHIRARGQHVLVARFLDRVVPIQLGVPFHAAPFDLSDEPRGGLIDEEILRVLGELHLPVSPQASDAAYLRRVSLDLTGRLPTPATVEAYLADEAPEKRVRLVDDLLASEAFADYWTLRLARLLRLHSLPHETESAEAYAGWLRDQLARGAALDSMARQLIMATGDSHVVGPANFSRMAPDARGQAELVGQFFLGARLGCANCHNHPLDKWTQADYHGLAAVFARLERGRIVQVGRRGSVTNPRTQEPATPRIPGVRDLEGAGDERAVLADWLTASENGYFARATVNRLWAAMFGRGLVEPTDDLRDTNPATHPELLERLARDFSEHDYDVRHTLKRIALSRAYGRSGAATADNAMDRRFYSHAWRRPLGPEVLADALADVTGVADEFAGRAQGTRAVALVDPLAPAPALDILGRCSRAGGCEESGPTGGGLPAQLHLLNGELVNRKLADDQGRLRRLIAAGRADEQIVDEFYLRALSRHPTDEELLHWREQLATTDVAERTSRLEDFLWSLLNSREFAENH